jgi:hypothetical protein
MTQPFDKSASVRTHRHSLAPPAKAGVRPVQVPQDSPLLVEIIAYAPTAYYHCTHCEVAWREMGATNRIHEEQMESSLPQDLIREYETVSDWVREMFRVHCDAILLKVIDAASLEGFYKSLRYNARRYPAVIVNRKSRFVGSEMLTAASKEIAHQLASEPASAS